MEGAFSAFSRYIRGEDSGLGVSIRAEKAKDWRKIASIATDLYGWVTDQICRESESWCDSLRYFGYYTSILQLQGTRGTLGECLGKVLRVAASATDSPLYMYSLFLVVVVVVVNI